MLQLKSVELQIGSKVILSGVNFDFHPGVTGILGPNGAGKSTILRAMAGLINMKNGEVLYRGKVIRIGSKLWRSLIGYTSQSPVLYEQLTARQYLAYMLLLSGVKHKNTLIKKVERTMIQFNLVRYQHIKISSLSGGIKQRIALAQAFVHDPSIILLDEPMNNLDFSTRKRVINLLMSTNDRDIVIYAGHELYEMDKICREIAILNDNRCVFYGSPAQIKNLARSIISGRDISQISRGSKTHTQFDQNKIVSDLKIWHENDHRDRSFPSENSVSFEDAYQIILNKITR